MRYPDSLPDHYRVLGVSRDATGQEIVAAYRREVRLSHPDLHPESDAGETRVREVNRAYEVLGDPARRAEYDGELSRREELPVWRARPPARHTTPRATWTVRRGYGSPYGRPSSVPPIRPIQPMEPIEPLEPFDDLLSLLDALFAEGMGEMGWGRARFGAFRGLGESGWGFRTSRRMRRPFDPF